jgi:hypothetical protein
MNFAWIFFKKSFFIPFLAIFLFILTHSIFLAILCNFVLHFLVAKIYFHKQVALAFVHNKMVLCKCFAGILGYNILILVFYGKFFYKAFA